MKRKGLAMVLTILTFILGFSFFWFRDECKKEYEKKYGKKPKKEKKSGIFDGGSTYYPGYTSF